MNSAQFYSEISMVNDQISCLVPGGKRINTFLNLRGRKIFPLFYFTNTYNSQCWDKLNFTARIQGSLPRQVTEVQLLSHDCFLLGSTPPENKQPEVAQKPQDPIQQAGILTDILTVRSKPLPSFGSILNHELIIQCTFYNNSRWWVQNFPLVISGSFQGYIK